MHRPEASRLLSDAVAEARRGAALLAELVDAAIGLQQGPDRDDLAPQIRQLAARARGLCLDARLQALARAGDGREIAQVAAEIAALADRFEEVARLMETAGDHRGAKLARRTSVITPPEIRPSTIS